MFCFLMLTSARPTHCPPLSAAPGGSGIVRSNRERANNRPNGFVLAGHGVCHPFTSFFFDTVETEQLWTLCSECFVTRLRVRST
jgi:hypothetical protein